jgi:hypothetical protein
MEIPQQAGRAWNQYLTKTLKENCFKQSDFDDCLFYFNDCIILILLMTPSLLGQH